MGYNQPMLTLYKFWARFLTLLSNGFYIYKVDRNPETNKLIILRMNTYKSHFQTFKKLNKLIKGDK